MTPLSERPGSALSRALPGLLFALLVVVIYADPLFHRRNFVGRDLLVYNLPMEKTIHAAYARGQLPIWTPEISGGRPILPNPNAGALYPLRPILSLFSFPTAMRVYPVVHWLAAGLGMILLVRTAGGSRAAAWLGATTYVFSGVVVAEVFFPHIQPGMSLLPWITWAVARRWATRGGKLLVLSILFSLILLAGDVFTIGMALSCAGLWILLEIERSSRGSEAVLVALAVILAGLAALPQIVATALWIPETNRAVSGIRLGEAAFFSIHPLRLLELIVPFPFGRTWTLSNSDIWGPPVFRGKGMGLFNTLYAGAFATIALVTGWKCRGPGVRFGRALFVLALALSVPFSLLPASWERTTSPLPLRNPEKFAVLLTFALALLSGFAVDRFRTGLLRPRWLLAVAVGLTAAAAGAALFPEKAARLAVWIVGANPGFAETAGRLLPEAFAEAGLLWMATLIAIELLSKPSRPALVAALAILALVPILANRRIARTMPEEGTFGSGYFARFLQRADPAGRHRTLGEALYRPFSPIELAEASAEPEGGGRGWIQYRQALAGRGTVFNIDFDAGDQARVQSLRNLSLIAARSPDPGPFFGNLALRWGMRYRDQSPLKGFRQVGGNGVESWDELPGALPDVRLARTWREEANPLSAADAVRTASLGELVVETGSLGRGTARPGTVEILLKTPERLVVRTEAPDPTWLFVLRGFWSYREVLVDGEPVECVPAQLAFSAVPVPAGRHRIDWRERVPGLEVSRWGPVLFALGIALLMVSERRRKAAKTT